jgi:uncharacterized protein involved in exopolysaccharide biosynthesis
LLGGIIALAGSFLLTKWYRAEAVLAPAKVMDSGGGLGSLGTQLGGLASLVGYDAGLATNTDEAIATLESRALIRQFILDRGLLPLLDGSAGPQDSDQDGTNDSLDLETAITKFKREILRVSKDRQSGLVTLSVLWSDRTAAAAWANELVARVNEVLRERAVAEAERSIEYLREEAEGAENVELKRSLYRLVEKHIETVVLARSNPDFAFRVVDPATPAAPDAYVRPRHVVLGILGMLLGTLAALMIAATRIYAR